MMRLVCAYMCFYASYQHGTWAQVIAMRLPVPVVTQHLKAILEGILLWSADTKNQFKLKVFANPKPVIAPA